MAEYQDTEELKENIAKWLFKNKNRLPEKRFYANWHDEIEASPLTEKEYLNLANEIITLFPTPQKPKIITLCGSSKFCDIMAVCAWLLERDEGAITMGLHLLPEWYSTKCEDHLAEAEGVASNMDALHLKKIDISDEIFVVNFNDYIGNSTRNEVEYTMSKNKPIRWFTHDKIGYDVIKMIHEATKTQGEV